MMNLIGKLLCAIGLHRMRQEGEIAPQDMCQRKHCRKRGQGDTRMVC